MPQLAPHCATKSGHLREDLRRRRHPHPRPMRPLVLPPLVPAPQGRGTGSSDAGRGGGVWRQLARAAARGGGVLLRHEAPPQLVRLRLLLRVASSCCACGRRVHGDCGSGRDDGVELTAAEATELAEEGGYLCPDCEDAEPTEGEHAMRRGGGLGAGSARQRTVAVPLSWMAGRHHVTIGEKVLALYQGPAGKRRVRANVGQGVDRREALGRHARCALRRRRPGDPRAAQPHPGVRVRRDGRACAGSRGGEGRRGCGEAGDQGCEARREGGGAE